MRETTLLDKFRGVPASDLWGYLLFSHGWTWTWWCVNIVGGYDAFGPGLPFTVLGGLGPLLGGIVMSYVTYGPEGVTDLWERLTDHRRISLRWGGLAIAFFPLFTVVTALVAGPLVGRMFPFEATGLNTLLAEPTALGATALVILLVGPLPEEIGWRG